MDTEIKSSLTLITEINIQAKPSVVWDILMDFEKYPEWNPFIISIAGDVKVGSRIYIKLKQPNSNPMSFKPHVQDVVENKKFSWLGHLFVHGLFDGKHVFELVENVDGSCTFIQKEYFNGILVSLFKTMIFGKTKVAFGLMNEAIKKRAENISARSYYN